MLGVRCQVSGVRCQVSGVRCQVLGVGCQVSGVRCEVSHVMCPFDFVNGSNKTLKKRKKYLYNIHSLGTLNLVY